MDTLPPRIPEALAEIDRAVALLGNRWRDELNSKARKELEGLVGCYPSSAQAAVWKSALRGLRQEMVELGDLRADVAFAREQVLRSDVVETSAEAFLGRTTRHG